MSKKLSANKVSQHLDISVVTLTNWYRWYNDDTFEKPAGTPTLPPYEQAGPRAPRYWTEEDLPLLEAFKAWIPRGRSGVMGAMNKRFWGKRGKNSV